MNSKEITIIKSNVTGQLTNKLISPLCIAGSPGTAKSTTVALIAAELGMNLVTCSGPTLSHEALSGLPDTVDASQFVANSIDGSTPSATQWSIPEIMAHTITAAADKPTILLIDDFHMVSPHLQSYFYSLLLERRLGNFRLSDNTAVILTMNDSDLAGFNGINSAVRNRMSILKVDFNFEHWFANYGNQLHYLVASFLKAKPHYTQEDETTGILGYATPRAWTAIAAELSLHEDPISFAYAVAHMQVSTAAAQAFQAHVAYIQAIDFTKLVASRTLVDLSKQDPLDSIIYSYITNFIHTLDDAMYLFELLAMNHSNAASAFVGFVIGELYIKQRNIGTASDGLKFIIKKLSHQPMIASDYPNTSKAKFDKLSVEPIAHIHEYMKIASQYLL